MLEISKKLIKVIQGLIFFSHVMLVKRFQYLSIYQEIHEIGLAFLLLLTLNRLGGDLWRPSSFICPSNLIFDTITVKFCDF